jgi:outer membrane protein assembly factor BamB
MRKKLAWPLAALTLVACDAEKTPITGSRVAVVNYESSVKVDAEVQDRAVSLSMTEMGHVWPQIGGRADHAMPNLSLNDSLAHQWAISVGSESGEGRCLSTPIVAGDVLYVLNNEGKVTAMKTSTGQVLWNTDISPQDHEGYIIGGGLAYENGKIFVTSPHAEVLALDAQNGKILWRFSMPSPVRAAPTLADGRLYVLTISNQLEVIDAEKGVRLWNHAGITEHAGLLGTASPAVSNGVVVVTYSSGEIFALKAENGHQLWTETLSTTRRPDSLSSLSHIKALPVIDKNIVIIIGHNQKMAAYDLRKGERLWERHIGGTRTPAVVGDYVFMINSHNELICITRDHGQVVWVRKLDSDREHPYKVIWNGPIVAGSKLYLVSMWGDLVAVDPSDGKTLFKHNAEAPLSLPPIVAQETLYLLTDKGEIKAFR